VWVAGVEVLTGRELDQGRFVVAVVGDTGDVGKVMMLGMIVVDNDCCCLGKDNWRKILGEDKSCMPRCLRVEGKVLTSWWVRGKVEGCRKVGSSSCHSPPFPTRWFYYLYRDVWWLYVYDVVITEEVEMSLLNDEEVWMGKRQGIVDGRKDLLIFLVFVGGAELAHRVVGFFNPRLFFPFDTLFNMRLVCGVCLGIGPSSRSHARIANNNHSEKLCHSLKLDWKGVAIMKSIYGQLPASRRIIRATEDQSTQFHDIYANL
jgi:hypothetical protein